MSQFPSLADILGQHARRIDPNHPAYGACRDCGFDPDVTPGDRSFAEHQRDAWRGACTVTTAEQLDALPVTSVVFSTRHQLAWQNTKYRGHSYPGGWQCEDPIYPGIYSTATLIDLGVDLLLWHPDWAVAS